MQTDHPKQHMTAEEKTDKKTVVFDNYVIHDCLGVGTMSTVYLVTELGKPRNKLALKVLHPGITDEEIAARRFQRELLATYKITDPNVIRAFEFLRRGARVAYTMEYAPGGSLRGVLDSDRTLTIDEITKIGVQFASGLAAIHSSGVVHRNLRPENLLIGKRGELKIADFGIARLMNAKTITRKGQILGSIEYSSPEYVNLGRYDRRSDIYSFGLIMHELIVGVKSNNGSSALEMLVNQSNQTLRLPSDLRPDCPKFFDKLVEKACRPDPDTRFQCGEEILSFFEDNYQRASSQHLANVTTPNVTATVDNIEAVQEKWNSKLWSNLEKKSVWPKWCAAGLAIAGLAFFAYKYLPLDI